MSKQIRRKYLVLSLIFILIFRGCKEDNITETFSGIKFGTLLNDNIPYETIFSGKLSFQRTPRNSTNSIALIDPVKKTAYSICIGGETSSISPMGDKIVFRGLGKTTWTAVTSSVYDGSLNYFELHDPVIWVNFPGFSYNGEEIFFVKRKIDGYYVFPHYLCSMGSDNLSNPYEYYNFKLDEVPYSPFSHSIKENSLIYSNGASIIRFNLYSRKTDLIYKKEDKENLGAIYTPCYSPDEERIAFAIQKTRREGNIIYPAGGIIMIYDPLLKKSSIIYQWDVSDRLADICCGNELSVCWSPDGNKLAFSKTGSNFDASIFIINTDGTGLAQITNTPNVTDGSVSWSKK